MSTRTRVIKNTGFLYMKMGITVFISLYTTRLILASLGASDFGLFNIVGGAISMLGFLNSTMANATQRFMSYAEGENNIEKKRQVFNVSIVLHLFIAFLTSVLLFGAMVPLFSGVLNIEPARVMAARVVYISLIISTAFTVVNVPYDAVINAHENMLYYSLIGIVEALLKLAVAFACVYTAADKLIVYGVLMAFIPCVTLTVMKVYCHRKYEECVISFRRFWNGSLLREITSFSGWNFLTAVSSMLSTYGVGIVLNHFFGTILNAAQGIANQVNGQLSAFSLNLMKAVNPIIVKRAGSQNLETMNHATLLSGKFSTLLIVFFAVPFILEMDYVLHIWLKDVPLWTSLFCCLQLLITITNQLCSSTATALYAEGHIKWYAIYKSIMNFAPVVFTYLAFYYGCSPYWLYICLIAFGALGGDVVILYYANRQCHLSPRSFVAEVVVPVLVVVAMMCAGGSMLQLVIAKGFFRLVMSASVTSIIFVISVWFVAFREQERMLVRTVMNKLVSKFYRS